MTAYHGGSVMREAARMKRSGKPFAQKRKKTGRYLPSALSPLIRGDRGDFHTFQVLERWETPHDAAKLVDRPDGDSVQDQFEETSQRCEGKEGSRLLILAIQGVCLIRLPCLFV